MNRRIGVCVLSLTIALSLSASVVAATVDDGEGSIRPGAPLGPGCRMGFLFASFATAGEHVGKVWVLASERCVGEVGSSVSAPDVEELGIVEHVGVETALVAVDPSHASRVDPAVLGFPELPRSGVFRPRESEPLETLRFADVDLPATMAHATARVGTLLDDTETTYALVGNPREGDLGGPVLHARTGFAYALVGLPATGPAAGPGLITGPTLEAVLNDVNAAGFPAELMSP